MNENLNIDDVEKFSFTRELFDWIESALLAIIAAFLIFVFIGRVVTVNGVSMNPTLVTNDKLVCTTITGGVKKGDVVVVTKPNSKEVTLIKRVIAVGGDTIDFDFENGKVIVNGEIKDEPFIAEQEVYYYDTGQSYPLEIPEGYVFIMGDNRNYSWDSRIPEVGIIDNRYVMAKVVLRLTPFEKFGRI